jgi:hypothetical protein
MNPNKVFKDFVRFLQELCGESVQIKFVETEIPRFEELFLPSILKILQKDVTLFDSAHNVFGVDLKDVWKSHPDCHADMWKHIQSCMIGAMMSGDVMEKVGKISEILKSVWGDSGHSMDDVEKILGDTESTNKIGEFLEFLMTTRVASLFMNIIQSIDMTELNIDLENPEDIADMMRNPETQTIIQKITKQVQDTLQKKLEHGEFTREILMRDIEQIKLKVQSMFGDVFNEFLGTRNSDVPAQVLMSSSPDARRARMLARLQRKLKAKNSS